MTQKKSLALTRHDICCFCWNLTIRVVLEIQALSSNNLQYQQYLGVCHTSVLYWNVWMDPADFRHSGYTRRILPVLQRNSGIRGYFRVEPRHKLSTWPIILRFRRCKWTLVSVVDVVGPRRKHSLIQTPYVGGGNSKHWGMCWWSGAVPTAESGGRAPTVRC